MVMDAPSTSTSAQAQAQAQDVSIEIVEIVDEHAETILSNEIIDTSKERVFLTCRNKTPSDCYYFTEEDKDKKSGCWFFKKISKLLLWTPFEILIIVIITAALNATIIISRMRNLVLWKLLLWEWEVMLLGMINLRHIIKMVITLLTLFVAKIFRSKRWVVYFIHGMQKDVHFYIMVSTIFIPLHLLLSEKATTEQNMVVLLAIKVSPIIIFFPVLSLVKSGVVMSFSTWFHMKAYQDWIEESIFNWYVVETFLGVPYKKNRHLWNPKRTSPWSMKKKIINKKIGLCMTIKDEYDAKFAASKILGKVAKPGSNFIDLADISRFLPENDAKKFMLLFHESNKIQPNQIRISLLQVWMVHAVRQEKSLFLSLKTMDATKNKANKVIKAITWIIFMMLFLTFIGLVNNTIFTIFSTSLAFTSFIFGAAWKTIFDSMVFVFIEHPFDVGDRCEIEEIQMVVEDIHILHTIFIGFDKTRYEFTNVNLMEKTICNYDRGRKYKEWEEEKEKND